MKSLFYTILIILSTSATVHAQFDYKNIYAGGSLGLAINSGELSTFIQLGMTYAVDVGYNINDKFSMGLELGQIFASGTHRDTITQGVFTGSGIARLGVYSATAVLAKSTYRFVTEGKVKPYVGLGLGAAFIREPVILDNQGNRTVARRTGLAISPEAGVSLNGFVFSYSYNHFGRTPEDTMFNFNSPDLPLSFHEIKAGFIYNF